MALHIYARELISGLLIDYGRKPAEMWQHGGAAAILAPECLRSSHDGAPVPIDVLLCLRLRPIESLSRMREMEIAMRAGHKATIVRISGRVQGVSFRVWTRAEAIKLGLTGWVRNEGDGSVTALIAGSDAAVSALMKKLWIGPSGASVSNVTFEVVDLDEEPTSFRITMAG